MCQVRQQRAQGFTLIEVTIAIAIMAMMVAVTVPAISNLTRADLRKSANMVAGFVRVAYDRAILEGRLHRVRFDVKAGALVLEATEDRMRFAQEGNALVESTRRVTEEQNAFTLPWGETLTFPPPDEEGVVAGAVQGLFSVGQLAADERQTSSFHAVGSVLKLSGETSLMSLWVQDGAEEGTLTDLTESGSGAASALYFFPHGYTQESIIHLQDSGEQVYSVAISALTGKTRVYSYFFEAAK